MNIEVGLGTTAQTALLLSSPGFTSFAGAMGSALGIAQQKKCGLPAEILEDQRSKTHNLQQIGVAI